MLKKILNLIIRKKYPIYYWKKKGLKIGSDCRLVGNVDFGSEPFLITIGDHVSITNSQFITHDGGVWIFRKKNPKIDVFKKVNIGSNVFIGANCIIMLGAIIEDNVVVGAGSIVTKKLQSGYVYAGIPAKKIKTIDEYYDSLNKFETKLMTKSEKKQFLLDYFENKY